MEEEWRPVVGWEGLYEISDLGRVRNAQTGLIRKVFVSNVGYWIVHLTRRGGGTRYRKNATIHSLVAKAFMGDMRFPGAEIDHIDGQKLNNVKSNLQWVSRSENHRRAYALGLRKYTTRKIAHGERHYATRLTDRDVLTIRRSPGLLRELAAEYGVSIDTISRIRLRKGWKHLP